MKSYSQHIEALRTLGYLASTSSDLNMRSKQATADWLANEWAALERERDRLAEDLSPTKIEVGRE